MHRITQPRAHLWAGEFTHKRIGGSIHLYGQTRSQFGDKVYKCLTFDGCPGLIIDIEIGQLQRPFANPVEQVCLPKDRSQRVLSDNYDGMALQVLKELPLCRDKR